MKLNKKYIILFIFMILFIGCVEKKTNSNFKMGRNIDRSFIGEEQRTDSAVLYECGLIIDKRNNKTSTKSNDDFYNLMCDLNQLCKETFNSNYVRDINWNKKYCKKTKYYNNKIY